MLKKLKKNLPMIFIGLAFLVGVGLIAYPAVSNWWNSMHATRAIASYSEAVDSLSEADYSAVLEAAEQYNEELLQQPNRYFPTDEFHEQYEETLNVNGNGIIGQLEIPKINVNLPIYHGTDESVLQVGVGHIEGTSLPIGGEGTHAALSGHRGLPSARLLTDLDKMTEGDYFIVTVLNEKYTYQVYDIAIVEPEELSKLEFEEGEDLITLVTCTPYGINSHRLLVTGHRVDNLPDDYVDVTNNAFLIDNKIVALVIGVVVLVLLLVLLLIKTRKKKEPKSKDEHYNSVD